MNAAMPPLSLGFGDHVQGHRGLARALGAEDLDDAPTRDATDPERDVEGHGAGGDDPDPGTHGVLAQLHDGALAELLLDLLERDVEHLVAVHRALLVGPCPSGGEVPAELADFVGARTLPSGSDITYTPVIRLESPRSGRTLLEQMFDRKHLCAPGRSAAEGERGEGFVPCARRAGVAAIQHDLAD